jgi:hypothetical protein
MPPICRIRTPDVIFSSGRVRCNELRGTGARCGRVFENLRRARIHITEMHRARRYPCSSCPSTFPTGRARATHFLEVHGIERTCTKCCMLRVVHEACAADTYVCAQCIRADMRLEKRLESYCRKHASFGSTAIYDTPLSSTCIRRPDQLVYGPNNLVIIGELDENAHRDRPFNYHADREAEIRADPSMAGKIVVVVHLSMENELVEDPNAQIGYFQRYIRVVESILTRPPPRAVDFYIGDRPFDINPDVPAVIEEMTT